MTNQKYYNVQALLELRGCTHLVDSLEFISPERIEAIGDMAEELQERQSPTEIASRVEHDVEGFLANEQGFRPYCLGWLNIEKQEA
jgi:hypothetical protein